MKVAPMRVVLSFASLVVISVVLSGALLGQTRPIVRNQEDAEAMKLFDTLLVLVEENYATAVDPERAVYGAIDGMLRTLDPHSKFFDPRAFKQLREDQSGVYAGLGISVRSMLGRVTVVQPPFPDSPAEKAGLRVGDAITHVDGASTDGLVTDDVVTKLRGRPGTAVNITVARPGVATSMQHRVVREEIKRKTINHFYVIRPNIAYLKIDTFGETTGDELKAALRRLNSRNLEGLVLDLRNNPGGLLTEAIRVSETFLKRGQLILETGGRTPGSSRKFSSEESNPEPAYPLVVLINQGSASASEIVAGAIQDHDRGLIVGETSFGKGLVQSVYTLRSSSGEHTGLALTTQKWYTPSGRLIQRDYQHVSNFDYLYRRDRTSDEPRERKFSDSGRVVYGGGGITPDEVAPAQKFNDFQALMLGEPFYPLFFYVQDYLVRTPAVDNTFQATDAILQDFKQYLARQRVEYGEKDFEANADFLKSRIQSEVLLSRFGPAEAQKVLNESDTQLLKALELLPRARELQNAKPRITAER
jgi:carboxyl-terminal processing protease